MITLYEKEDYKLAIEKDQISSIRLYKDNYTTHDRVYIVGIQMKNGENLQCDYTLEEAIKVYNKLR